MEDYLEAIYNLEKLNKVARVKDIAKWVDVKMPSVSGALKPLIEKGLVRHEKHGYVELTPEGAKAAERVHQRHKALSEFLAQVFGLDCQTAEADACKMEHVLSPATMERFLRFAEFVNVCPRAGTHWLEHFARYCQHGAERPHGCEKCLTTCMDKFLEMTGEQSDTDDGAHCVCEGPSGRSPDKVQP